MMTTVKWLREKSRKLTAQTAESSNHEIIAGKIIIKLCSVDGEIIPVKMMCEDGCNREIYVGSTCEQNSQVI